eukprot:gnl/Dysnectes_brevis/296_a329_6783.p2 GENE.gnl/Dysnectes_brevis/296_a329_6783~~gnl/Dysnectes_brevis/296_a329_6783.p2  ORF type:complete len:337 (+),score=84.28 gnl/Dysnectes_brevis/296_a329_6783:45-1055(+)
MQPSVQVYNVSGEAAGELPTPAVFSAPIRGDIVQFVHTNLAKNHRQPYAVNRYAGKESVAKSWGPGRAVARVPRKHGGIGSTTNMCRGGHMFNPTRVTRKWHRKVNVNMRRFAMVSALAACAVSAMVQARGHRIASVPSIPLVVDMPAPVHKTKEAIAILKAVGAYEDVLRCKESRKLRSGMGKMRNRRYVTKRGPLVVYKDEEVYEGFRNLPGVELMHVDRLNVLSLCPGGHMGRFVIWTKSAFAELPAIYGTKTEVSEKKSGYMIPRGVMTKTTNMHRILRTETVQASLRARKPEDMVKTPRFYRKINPLTNRRAHLRLNPHFKVVEKARAALK